MLKTPTILALGILLTFVYGSPHRKIASEDDDVVLRLFTRQNPTDYQLLQTGDYVSVVESNFDLSKPVKFFSNGRMSPWQSPELVEAFLTAGDVNVVMVDWSKINQSANETYLIESAIQTGHVVSAFIDWLYTLGFSFSNVHLIGFSIGCHAAAYQARFCKRGVVEYLTGLDPPVSNYVLGGDHMNANDAKYVEVIHTSFYSGNTFADPLGDADFYPNGGAYQPGCEPGSLCNHARAMGLYRESIVSDGFVSKKCSSFEEMANNTCAGLEKAIMGGTGVAKNISGIFYLTTNGASPFAQGDI